MFHPETALNLHYTISSFPCQRTCTIKQDQRRIKAMKTTMLLALMVALTALTACETDVKTAATADTTAVDHAGAIAGDKTMTADLMHQSFEKGTFDDALTIAMQDSALAREVAAIVKQHPELLADAIQPATGSATRATASRAVGTTVRRTTTTTSKGDVLDQTENKAKQVNQKLDQAARIKKEAEEAKK